MRYFMRLLYLLCLMCIVALDTSSANDAQDISYWQSAIKNIKAGMTRSQVTKLLPLKSDQLASISGGWDYEAYTFTLNGRFSLMIVYKRIDKTSPSQADIVLNPPRIYDRTLLPEKNQ